MKTSLAAKKLIIAVPLLLFITIFIPFFVLAPRTELALREQEKEEQEQEERFHEVCMATSEGMSEYRECMEEAGLGR